jgi:hypothetical protein
MNDYTLGRDFDKEYAPQWMQKSYGYGKGKYDKYAAPWVGGAKDEINKGVDNFKEFVGVIRGRRAGETEPKDDEKKEEIKEEKKEWVVNGVDSTPEERRQAANAGQFVGPVKPDKLTRVLNGVDSIAGLADSLPGKGMDTAKSMWGRVKNMKRKEGDDSGEVTAITEAVTESASATTAEVSKTTGILGKIYGFLMSTKKKDGDLDGDGDVDGSAVDRVTSATKAAKTAREVGGLAGSHHGVGGAGAVGALGLLGAGSASAGTVGSSGAAAAATEESGISGTLTDIAMYTGVPMLASWVMDKFKGTQTVPPTPTVPPIPPVPPPGGASAGSKLGRLGKAAWKLIKKNKLAAMLGIGAMGLGFGGEAEADDLDSATLAGEGGVPETTAPTTDVKASEAPIATLATASAQADNAEGRSGPTLGGLDENGTHKEMTSDIGTAGKTFVGNELNPTKMFLNDRGELTAGSVAGFAVDSAVTGAVIGGGAAALTGGGILSGAAAGATAGATAGLAILTSPAWLLGGAVLAVGAGAYYGYKYFTRDDAGPISRLRMLQYGLTEKHKENFHKVFELEEYLQLKVQNAGVILDFDKSKISTETIAEMLDVNKESVKELNTMTEWFKNRFKPVFLRHFLASRQMKLKETVRNSDDISNDVKLLYFNSVNKPSDAYNVMASPFKSDYALATTAEVEFFTKDLLKEVKELVGEKSATSTVIAPPKAPEEGMPTAKLADGEGRVGSSTDGSGSTNSALINKAGVVVAATSLMLGGSAVGGGVKADEGIPDDMDGETESTENIPLGEGAPAMGNGVPSGIPDSAGGEQFIQPTTNSAGELANINDLDPTFLTRLKGLAIAFHAKTGKRLQVDQGFRTFAQQDALFKRLGAGLAARPGTSLHEKGIAADIGTEQGNELESLGLLKQHGFTRPVRGEPWHIEAAGLQGVERFGFNTPSEARAGLINAGVGRGGGGLGTVTKKGDKGKPKRDPSMQAALFNAPPVYPEGVTAPPPTNMSGTPQQGASATSGGGGGAAPPSISTGVAGSGAAMAVGASGEKGASGEAGASGGAAAGTTGASPQGGGAGASSSFSGGGTFTTGSIAALLNSGESRARGYNDYNRGNGADTPKPASNKANIPLTTYSISKINELQALPRGHADRLFAVGMYQMVPNTFKETVEKMGIGGGEIFTPALQDRMFSERLAGNKRPKIVEYIKGGGDLSEAGHAAAQEWGSIGSPKLGGRGALGAGQHVSISASTFAAALTAARTKYAEEIKAGADPKTAYAKAIGLNGGAPAATSAPMASPAGGAGMPMVGSIPSSTAPSTPPLLSLKGESPTPGSEPSPASTPAYEPTQRLSTAAGDYSAVLSEQLQVQRDMLRTMSIIAESLTGKKPPVSEKTSSKEVRSTNATKTSDNQSKVERKSEVSKLISNKEEARSSPANTKTVTTSSLIRGLTS